MKNEIDKILKIQQAASDAYGRASDDFADAFYSSPTAAGDRLPELEAADKRLNAVLHSVDYLQRQMMFTVLKAVGIPGGEAMKLIENDRARAWLKVAFYLEEHGHTEAAANAEAAAASEQQKKRRIEQEQEAAKTVTVKVVE